MSRDGLRRRRAGDSTEHAEATAPVVDPGKRSLTQALPARAKPAALSAAAARPSLEDDRSDDPFGLHLLGANDVSLDPVGLGRFARSVTAFAPRSGDPFALGRVADMISTDVARDDDVDAAAPVAPKVPWYEQFGTAPQRESGRSLGFRDVGRALFSSPLTLLPREAQDVVSGPLMAKLRERESIRLFLGGRADPVADEVADVLADLANDPVFSTAFATGAVMGTARAVVDTVKGIAETAELIGEISVAFATFRHRELLERAKDAIDELVEAAPAALAEFTRRWTAGDSYERGVFQGEVVGYVVTQLAIMIAGFLSTGPVIAGPFGNVIRSLGWIDNPLSGVAELAHGARLSNAALDTLRAAPRGADHANDPRTAVARAGDPPSPAPPSDAVTARSPAIGTAKLVPDSVPSLDVIEQVTGVSKGPRYEDAMADLRRFYAEMEVEAQRPTHLHARAADGPYKWDFGHESRRFSHGPAHVILRVHLTPWLGVDASHLATLRKDVVRGVDEHYNFRPASDRGRLHLEVEFVDDPADAHLHVVVRSGKGRANLYRWYAHDEPTTHAHEVGHAAFGFLDEYADPRAPGRAHENDVRVTHDGSLMGNYLEPDAFGRESVAPGTGLRARHWDVIWSLLPGSVNPPAP